MALAITAFAYTGAQAQTTTKTVQTQTTETKVIQTAAKPAETKMVCKPVTTKPTAAKRKVVTKKTTKTASTVTACRMVPYQVCTIMPDRQHVSCYTSTDGVDQTQTGPTTVYGPTGPMPGQAENFDMRTIVVKGKNKGSYCKIDKTGKQTICYKPGVVLLRDDLGYYSYGELPPNTDPIATVK